MPGVGISQAQCKSIVWTWGYLRLHTDLKSTPKWPQHGVNTWHMRYFSGILGRILTDFGYLGLGMSHAQFKSIAWTSGYLRLHTDLKSTHKWPQCGANTWHMRHFSGIWGQSLTDFQRLGLGWVKHSSNQLSEPQVTSNCTQTWNPLTNGLSVW